MPAVEVFHRFGVGGLRAESGDDFFEQFGGCRTFDQGREHVGFVGGYDEAHVPAIDLSFDPMPYEPFQMVGAVDQEDIKRDALEDFLNLSRRRRDIHGYKDASARKALLCETARDIFDERCLACSVCTHDGGAVVHGFQPRQQLIPCACLRHVADLQNPVGCKRVILSDCK